MKTTHLSSFIKNMQIICLAVLFIAMYNETSGQEKQVSPNFDKNEIMDINRDCLFPPDWNEPLVTPHVSAVIIKPSAKILINGEPLNEGDGIGAFYLDENGNPKCGGFSCMYENMGEVLAIFGDDSFTPEKDGFSNGEEIIFKLFSWSCMHTFDVDSVRVTGFSFKGNPTFPMGYDYVEYMNCNSTYIDCHTWNGYQIKFTEGWNDFVFPETKISTQTFFDLFDGSLVLINEKNGTGIYWPEMEIFTLDLIPGRTYKLLIDKDFELAIPNIQ